MTTRPDIHDGSPQPDRNFDDLAGRFRKTIYDTPKGRLRLAALRQDFADYGIPLRSSRVLDLGGGQGQFSLELANQGAAIHLCDVSAEMIQLAQQSFSQANLDIKTACSPLQDVEKHFPGTFDVVMNHAVLEWLEQPFEVLPAICSKVNSKGWLSLMFYNLHGHQWRQLMNGRTHAPTASSDSLRKAGNAPQHPLDPDKVFETLPQCGMEIQGWRGIRCIHDHMHQKIRDRIGEEAVEKADLEFGSKDPYRLLGRYIHVIARKMD